MKELGLFLGGLFVGVISIIGIEAVMLSNDNVRRYETDDYYIDYFAEGLLDNGYTFALMMEKEGSH